MPKYITMNWWKTIFLSGIGIVCGGSAGLIWFALQSNLIIIRWPQKPTLAASLNATREIPLWYYKYNQWIARAETVIWPTHPQNQLEIVTQSWLHQLSDESLIKMVSLQATLLSRDQKTVYLSFTKSPFNKQQSIDSKLKIIEGLSKTLKEALPSVQGIQLLVNHKPLQDPHLDFLQPWSLYC